MKKRLVELAHARSGDKGDKADLACLPTTSRPMICSRAK